MVKSLLELCVDKVANADNVQKFYGNNSEDGALPRDLENLIRARRFQNVQKTFQDRINAQRNRALAAQINSQVGEDLELESNGGAYYFGL